MINQIIQQSCTEGLKPIPDNTFHCCVTSPPYFGLRDYGHKDQIGLEQTPEEYIQKLVEVFREVKRTLRPDGTLWLNIGDSYAGAGGASGHSEETKNMGAKTKAYGAVKSRGKTYGLKPKDLIGIPWMIAFALRADGWFLRQDIIWNKPNPMPESVTDRCTKAHEYIFLLSKSQKYYYDAEAIKTNSKEDGKKSRPNGIVRDRLLDYDSKEKELRTKVTRGGFAKEADIPLPEQKANKRSVWTVNTKPYKDAHFATFPQELIIDCIKAGCPINGTVLDPFGGAGTTAVVARKLERNFTLFEINPDYINIANKRLLKELGAFL